MPILENRQITVSTPVGDDKLFFREMTAREELGRPFMFELDLIGSDRDIPLKSMLGKHVTVSLELPQNRKRHFDGLVSRFDFRGVADGFAAYRATLRPWLWFLSRSADCRIFQEKSARDIILEVFREHGFSDFRTSLSETYRKREYCVQYRETAFEFVSRLMEEEGIYYYFEHDPRKHTLVLCDSPNAHVAYPDYATLPYFPPERQYRRTEDHVWALEAAQEVQTGRYVTDDFDFEHSRGKLEAKASTQAGHPLGDMEVFDYPGRYTVSADGTGIAAVRMQELQVHTDRVRCEGNARGVAAGHVFTLQGFDRSDQNRKYLIVSALHRLTMKETDEDLAGEQVDSYVTDFSAMAAQKTFRPERVTRKPVVQGPQTAMVVGPSGEEIHTDKFGRVKVQFHWDRRGKSDENSSCWIRVAQVWAGAKWGGMLLPRVGQEVIVDFLEGDPDRPIVTGRVYNDMASPPYALPGEATKSTLKSNSSKGGGGFNEVRFEDKKGAEELFLHAQKDMKVVVLNDQTLEITNHRKKTIEKGDETVAIKGGHRTTSIDMGNDELTLRQGSRKVTVSAGKSTLTAGQSIELKVGANSVVIDQRGVTIKGTLVNVQATAKCDVKGAITNVSGDGLLVLKGGLIKAN